MEIKDLLGKYEEKYPLSLQEEWDNSGLQLGNVDNKLEGIVLSLDLEYEAIKMAIDKKANLIINHHPLLFSSLDSIDLRSDIGKKIELLIKNDITLYASHTNLDRAKDGLNDHLADLLGLKDVNILEDKNEVNMARYGFVGKTSAKDFANLVKNKLKASGTILYGQDDKEIEKVALCGGAGSDFLQDAINQDCDLIVTGDIKYHEAIDSISQDIAIVDPGHFASENHVIYKLEDDLKKISDVGIYTYSKEDNFRTFI